MVEIRPSENQLGSNGASAPFQLLVPRTFEMKHVKNDLRQTSHKYVNIVDVEKDLKQVYMNTYTNNMQKGNNLNEDDWN